MTKPPEIRRHPAIPFSDVLAQGDFRDGYIITTQGDTVFQQIAYGSNKKNYRSCRTKDAEYRPGDLRGYGFINDKYFESGIVEGSFVEVIIRGELSLYLHNNVYLVKKLTGLPVSLQQATVEKGETTVMKDAKWKGNLAFLIHDCQPDPDALRKLRFSERSITELVTRYNTCRQSPFTASKASKQWTKVQMGITAGVTRSTLLTENIYDLSYMADRYHAVDAFTGMTFLISSPRISDHLKFQPEALVSKVNYSSSIVQKPASFYTNYYDTEIEVTTLSAPLVVVYSLPEGKHFLQFHAGLNLDMHFTSDITVHREKVYNGVSTTTTEKPPLAIRKKQLGYLVGLAAFRSFSEFRAGLQLRYAGIGGYSDTVEFGYENRKLSLSLTVQVK